MITGGNMNFQNLNVLVCGLGLSGISSARLLNKLGADVTINDIKSIDNFTDIANDLQNEGIKLFLGQTPDEIINSFQLVILSPGIPCDLPFVTKAVNSGIPVWGEIELAYSICPCNIIAITGTNGKTTTTALVGEIMRACNPRTEVVGNIGVPFCEKVLDMQPQDSVVAEISSFQLETIHDFHPNICAILNVTNDHLSRHKTMENYTYTKSKIFSNQQNIDFLVLNYDNPITATMYNYTDSYTVYFSRIELLREGVFVDGSGYIQVRLPWIQEQVVHSSNLQIPGNHNLENALAAIAIAVCANVPMDVIREVLCNFAGVEHRIEFVRELRGVSYYNDSKATNPDSAIKALEAFSQPIILIAGGSDKDSDYSEWVSLFSDKVKHLVLVGDVKENIAKVCDQYNYTRYSFADSFENAVELAYNNAQRGDCVLLSPACASFDFFKNFEHRGKVFKELVWKL